MLPFPVPPKNNPKYQKLQEYSQYIAIFYIFDETFYIYLFIYIGPSICELYPFPEMGRNSKILNSKRIFQ